MARLLKFFMACLLTCNLLTANYKPADINGLHYVGALSVASAAYVACTYAQAQLSDRHNTHIEDEYPYAQAWLEEMIVKYPNAQLDQLTFLQSAPWMSQGPMAWQSLYKKVYCPKTSLQRINDLYYEKLHPKFLQKLTLYEDNAHDDEIDLKIAEFLLVRQAYHCTTHTTWIMPLQFLTTAGVIAGISELLSNTYFNKAANYAIQAPIAGLLLYNMLERQELQADEFAYLQSVDSNIFNGAYAYFVDEELQCTMYDIQAPLDQRIDKMLEYINFLKKDAQSHE